MAIWPFKRGAADIDGERLLTAVTAASRKVAFFGAGKAADTLEGRFEIMALNASLALIRLQAEAGAAPLAQSFTDQLFRQFDAGLREEGVSDTAVPKRMHKLAGAFYGRRKAYAAALSSADPEALTAAVSRNVLGADTHPFAAALAGYAIEAAGRQAGLPITALFSDQGWPQLG
jgi:cytochrome b pre-mRNA-processing protein 3